VNLTLSRPIQILALVGLLAAVAGGGMLMLKAKPPATATPPTVAELRARAHARERATAKTPTTAKHAVTAPATAKHSSRTHAATTAKKAAAKVATTTPAATTPAVTTPAAPAAKTPVSPIAANGLPTALANLLLTHKVVVVSLFDAQSQTDAISYAEAKAGAAAAGAGFLGVNVLDDNVAAPLTNILPGGGLLPDPGVLVFSAPQTLAIRLDGFADRDAVAQAAAQALTNLAAGTP